MSTESSPLPPVVKPLLLEALGKPFLAYELGATEDEVDQWLVGPNDEFGTLQQTQALGQLHIVLHGSQGDGDPSLRRLNLSSILGIYQEPFNTTLVNVIRGIATGEMAAPVESKSIEDILSQLVRDVYPLYLLPADADPFPSPISTASVYQNPLRQRFETAVMADEILGKLFQEESDSTGRHGSVLRSTGQGGGVQLIMFAEMMIGAGWRAASITCPGHPTLDEHITATLAQLALVRDALAGKSVDVPVRIAFTGVRLASDHPLDLGWGTLRTADGRDRHLVPRGIEGQLAGSGADGINVTIEYSGDIVLDTSMKYQVRVRDFDLMNEWPQDLRGFDQIQRLIESVQLGALLSEEFNPAEPITVLPTWRYIHDPLSHGYGVGWSDPRMSRSFIPKQLDEDAAEQWRSFAIAVEEHRTKYIDVAIRRTLRASAERRDFADVLMDAVIAWENLFGSRKGEPTLRVTGAIAWLLEDTSEKRASLRSELAKIYDMRSDVVHGNKMPSDQEIVPKSQRALGIAVSSLRVLFTIRLALLKECKTGDERSNMLLMGG